MTPAPSSGAAIAPPGGGLRRRLAGVLPRNRGWRVVLAVVAFFVVVNVLALITSTVRPQPAGRPGSSYATIPAGVAAYAELLRRAGFDVDELRAPLAGARPDPRGTLVVVDAPRLSRAERRTLGRFVEDGGRLVAAGRDPGTLLGDALVRPPRWTAAGTRRARPTVAALPETAGVRSVVASGRGGFATAGEALPVLGVAPILLAVARLGDGRALLLADAGPLRNDRLAQADNAAFALALAGSPERPLTFVESVHGYGERSGLMALPARWKGALVLAVLAGLLWLASRARRLGPAEQRDAAVQPARREHVDALALALRRSGDAVGALEPVRRAARAQVVRRAVLAADAPDEQVRAAALRLGLAADEAAALTAAPSDAGALAVGRALAKGRR